MFTTPRPFGALTLLLFVLFSGCTTPSITTVTPAPPPTQAPAPALSPQPSVLLIWQGYTEMGSDGDATRCKQFQVTESAIQLGYCDQPQTTVASAAALAQAKQFVHALAPFELHDNKNQLGLRGTGAESSPAWQRALVQWVTLKYAELESGHACASCATVFSWFLDKPTSETDLCRHVYVTSFGEAVAQKIKCHPQGDTPQAFQSRLLQTNELVPLDDWLYTRGQFEDGDNYFLGQGNQPLTPADQTAMQAWAEQIYKRLLPN